jgi:serpin B
MKTLLLSLLGLLIFTQSQTVFSASHDEKKPSKHSAKADRNNSAAVTASNAFGLEFYKKIRNKFPDKKNILVSPLSAFLAISMLYNDADKETKESIAQVLRSQGISPQDLNRANSLLQKALESNSESFQINIANALFIHKDNIFKKAFINRVTKAYQALIEKKDFQDPETVTSINDWVKTHTKGTIESIVDQLSTNDKLVLLNATYFLGKWTYPFDPEDTKPQNFMLDNGTKIKTDTMDQTRYFKYAKIGNGEAIELPYGKENEASMIVLLPSKGKTLQSFEKELTDDYLSEALSSLGDDSHKKIHLTFPKFKGESDIPLNDTLTAMGMGSSFTDEADFGKLSSSKTNVSKAIQKTYIEVDEVKTKAAAVTGIGIESAGMPLKEKITDMKIDRPFMYLIRDNRTGALLFIGAESNPKK